MKYLKIIVLSIIAIAAVLYFYDYMKYDLHKRPEMSEDSFSLIFETDTGPFKVIMVDMHDYRFDIENNRKYISIRSGNEVPSYYEESWSECTAPTKEERKALTEYINDRPGMRLEAVCFLKITEDEVIPTGLVASVPDI